MKQPRSIHDRCKSAARRRTRRALAATIAACCSLKGTSALAAPTQVTEVQFNEIFAQQQRGSRIDFSRFNQGSVALPGAYLAEFVVNSQWLGRADVTLRQIGGDPRNVQPCMKRELLERAGIDLNRLTPDAASLLANSAACPVLAELVDQASAVFDSGEQRLELSVPQLALVRNPRGYVASQYWDDGVPAMILQYNSSLYRSQSPGGIKSTHGYVGINLGINAGAWRLRHTGSYTHSNASGQTAGGYRSVQTNLRRAIAPLDSQFILGEAFTDGDLFDSVGFRGVRLATDDRMLPESQRGYAPTVRGVAASNARVQVRQNGNLLLETTVAPGPFAITDLYATGYGGDLQVAVTEANGRTSSFIVPYSAPVNALRPGVTRYSVTAGQYRNPSVSLKPYLVQGTVQRGFTNRLTGYGGLTLSKGYAAALFGAALNTSYGAFGLDLTHARTKQPARRGQSLRLAYSKLISPTNTNLTLAAYRYSSRGYLNLSDAVALRDLTRRNSAVGELGVARSQLRITVNQALAPGYGSFYLTSLSMNYWNRRGHDTQLQTGYNNSYGRLAYGIAVTRQRNLTSGRWDNRVMLTFGLPLGSAARAPYAITTVERGLNGSDTTVQQAVSGTLGVDSAFSYGLNASSAGGDGGPRTNSVGANAAYASPYATVNASVSQGSRFSQENVGASGTVVAYGGGLVFSPASGDTYAIIEAPDATGARLTTTTGARISPWGRALSTSLVPFARNPVTLDPEGLPLSVELKSTEQQAIPTAGAVVRVRFSAVNAGRTVVFQVGTADDRPLPFGADVTDAQGKLVANVGQSGRFIARGLAGDRGLLIVSWGKKLGERCVIRYSPSSIEAAKTSRLAITRSVCR